MTPVQTRYNLLLLVLQGFFSPLLAETYYFTTIAGRPGVPGSSDGINEQAIFYRPSELALDASGIYVSDTFNNTIRKITPAGMNWIVTTIAGTPGVVGALDGTNGDAQFYRPNGIKADGFGNLFIADHNNHSIRQATPQGTNWVVTTLAGLPGVFGTNDGIGDAARFRIPTGIAVDGVGRLFVVDTANFTLRMVSPVGVSWLVTTIAGIPLNYGFQDGVNELAAFNYPYGMALGPEGALYVTDAGNYAIRRVTEVPQGWATETIANSRGEMGSRDGSARMATFNLPNGICVDSATNVYVADQSNHTIRKLTASSRGWDVTTIGGVAGVPGITDGAGSGALFRMPWGIAVDAEGTIYVADAYNHTIRRGTLRIPLSMVRLDFDFILSWPTSGESYQLERAPALSDPGAWQTVTSGITIQGDRYVWTNQFGGEAMFFRLRR